MSKEKYLDAGYYCDRILEEFRFEKVHAFMEEMNWEWEDIERVPTVEELKELAHALLNEVISYWGHYGKGYDMNAGCFYASITKKGELSLRFSLEEMNSDYIDKSDEICENDDCYDEDDDSDIDPEVKEVYYDDGYIVDEDEE